jgi:hypothetical protein
MNKSLQNIYENIKSGKKSEEEVIKENNKFSKFDLKDYTEIVYEGKSGHGDQKAVQNMMNDAISKGLITAKETKGGWLLKSTDGVHQEAIHKGERALHYLRRFLQKLS